MVEKGFGSQVWGGWRSEDVSSSHGVGLWKYICMGWQIFKSRIRFDSGDGTKIRFWEDVCLENGSTLQYMVHLEGP
jgi:hypothetical protein